MATFTVEYQCQPTRLLEKMQSLFQKGREIQVTGYIVGWSEAKYTWIVDVRIFLPAVLSSSPLHLYSPPGPIGDWC